VCYQHGLMGSPTSLLLSGATAMVGPRHTQGAPRELRHPPAGGVVTRAWLLLLSACASAPPIVQDAPGVDGEVDAWNAWREERNASLAGDDGWLTLIGLHWLEQGETSVGSDPESGIVLPADRAPALVGRLIVSGTDVVLAPAQVSIEGAPVSEPVTLASDDPGPATVLEVGSLRMHVILRAGRVGLRVKDRESPARTSFEGITLYDHDPAMRVPATIVPGGNEVLPIVNVLGMEVDEPLAGRVRFELAGQRYELLAISGGGAPEDPLFVMFTDLTSQSGETYGAGRYLDVARPDTNGRSVIDFNYAHSPPCAYTRFATCPLAPPENALPIAIRAGERNPGH
jgi:uncharacterized protein (DUF1684 family)